MKITKSVTTERFKIELIEMPNGSYRISYVSSDLDPIVSEMISDLKLGLYMFDLKLLELEGH